MRDLSACSASRLIGQVDDGGPEGEAVIHIDDYELSMHELGKVLTSFAGWGMRIVMGADSYLIATTCLFWQAKACS